jgi:hypothetical protein
MSTSHKLVSLLLALGGVGGFVALLVLSAHHPAFAPFLRVLAFVWLGALGLLRLVIDLTEADEEGEEGAFDFTRRRR